MAAAIALALLALGGLVACARAPAPAPSPLPSVGASAARPILRNVLREDYAGSTSCRPCHADVYDQWMRGPMHGMTKLPDAATIDAPFGEGEKSIFRFKADRLTLEKVDARRYVRIESQTFGEKLYRVTKVIGGRHREDFAGVEVVGTEPGAKVVGSKASGGVERILPFSFMRASKSFRYKGYSVMEQERPALKAGGEWSRLCIFCHNTEPYLDVVFGALGGNTAGPFQGEVVDPLLPIERRWEFEVTDDAALRKAVVEEVLHIDPHATRVNEPAMTLRDVLTQAVKVTRARFGQANLLEIGIGCEACHGGSSAHVEHPEVRPSFMPRAPFFRVQSPLSKGAAGANSANSASSTSERAQAINRACARCHQVLFSKYPYTWEGGLRAKSPGGSHINSGEARDFLLGGCASAMSCVSCHDPHEGDGGARVRQIEATGGRALCTGCHAKYAGDDAIRAHTHHAPGGEGAKCIACHMPRKNMSLDTRLTRYHRIGSPTDPARVEHDRPLECALCHEGKSVGSLVERMETWWGKTYDRAALKALYGDLANDPLLVTLGVGKPHERATASFVVGEKKLRPAVPFLFANVTHPYPIVRYYVLGALESILAARAPFDLHRENALVEADARAWIGSKGVALPPPSQAAP